MSRVSVHNSAVLSLLDLEEESEEDDEEEESDREYVIVCLWILIDTG